jgi:lysophospholipase L1-like esterase
MKLISNQLNTGFGNLVIRPLRKSKFFFLGDSYTQSVEVSNEHAFFNILKDSLNIEVFAFGQSGYGTLQEYMILDKYLDLIQPDLIVLQTCDNDFLDNHFVLEREGGYNVRLRRPYLTLNNEVVYRMPIPEWKHWLSYSKFLTLLANKLEWIFTDQEGKVIAEAYIAEDERAYKPYNDAIKITGMILDSLVERVPENIRLIGFSSSVYQPQLDDMRGLFEERGIPLHDESAQLLYDVRGEGRSVHSADGFHWNIGGHQVIAEGLLPILKAELGKIREGN